jgi:hypothetical protein
MDVELDTCDGTTRASVRLAQSGKPGFAFHGIGLVRGGLNVLHPPEIAAELAVARALTDLTEELLEAVAIDIEAVRAAPLGV